jgi:putative restriction endonuclease
LIERFSRLNVWRREGEEAPHKPLLVLYALGRWYNDRSTRVAFRDVDRDLRELLREFGPERAGYHPEYPFWRLQNDDLWEVDAPPGLETRENNTDPKKSELLQHNVEAGFPATILTALESDPDAVFAVAQSILDARFPAPQHQAILERVGLTGPRT